MPHTTLPDWDEQGSELVISYKVEPLQAYVLGFDGGLNFVKFSCKYPRTA